MFIAYAAGPVTGSRVFERLRFAKPLKRIALGFLKDLSGHPAPDTNRGSHQQRPVGSKNRLYRPERRNRVVGAGHRSPEHKPQDGHATNRQTDRPPVTGRAFFEDAVNFNRGRCNRSRTRISNEIEADRGSKRKSLTTSFDLPEHIAPVCADDRSERDHE